MSGVDIGFAEECEPWQIESRLFPSKVGGKPAWLSLENIPKLENLRCSTCEKPMTFLCQIYAPYEDDEKNFHRTIFVFICRYSICCKRNESNNVKVFRSSIPRKNKFYAFDPPKEEKDTEFSVSKWLRLCELCGGDGDKNCGRCKSVMYCCRDHQIKDWKENHKNSCGKSEVIKKPSGYLFSEYELLIDSEEIDEEKVEVDEGEELDKLKRLEAEGQAGSLQDLPESEIENFSENITDKAFKRFKRRIQNSPDQVLRYERGGCPLWIAEEPKPESIPNCEGCKGPRQFEFQIMPQMLTVLKETAIDFGVLAIYTCKYSCDIGNNYVTEYCFKQDVTEQGIYIK